MGLFSNSTKLGVKRTESHPIYVALAGKKKKILPIPATSKECRQSLIGPRRQDPYKGSSEDTLRIPQNVDRRYRGRFGGENSASVYEVARVTSVRAGRHIGRQFNGLRAWRTPTAFMRREGD